MRCASRREPTRGGSRRRHAPCWTGGARVANVSPAAMYFAALKEGSGALGVWRDPSSRYRSGRCLSGAARWHEAMEAGFAPRVALRATHESMQGWSSHRKRYLLPRCAVHARPHSTEGTALAHQSASSDIRCTVGGSRVNRCTPAPPIHRVTSRRSRSVSSWICWRTGPRG